MTAVSNFERDEDERKPSSSRHFEIQRMHLKWFNASKGFGFLVPEDPSASYDAFVHVTVLQDAGLNSAGEGAVFDCEIFDSNKGKQIHRITNVISSGANPHSLTPSQDDNGNLVIGGIVKWYKPEKGFGFIIADDGQKDVFIHKTLLDRHDIENLDDGQRVRISVKPAEKGREATSIEIL